jgi:hypothetical protein
MLTDKQKIERRMALFAAANRRAAPQPKAAQSPAAKPQPTAPAAEKASRFAHLRDADLTGMRAVLAARAARLPPEPTPEDPTAKLAAAIVAHTNAARMRR